MEVDSHHLAKANISVCRNWESAVVAVQNVLAILTENQASEVRTEAMALYIKIIGPQDYTLVLKIGHKFTDASIKR